MYSHYFKKILKALGASAFIAAGMWSYGQGSLFEQVYLGLLGFIAILFIRDINMIGIILIEAVGHICSVLIWYVTANNMVIKILAYGFIGITLYLLKFEEKRKYIVAFVALSLGAEVYWLITGYRSPEIYFYLMLININLIQRHLLFSRAFITARFAPARHRSLEADLDLYNLIWLYVLVHIAMVTEYFLRHLFGLNITAIYEFSPYIFHGLSAYAAWIIFSQGAKILSERWIHA